MTAILAFTDWATRFTDAEFALFRHRMRGVQFIGGNIQRRWDQAIAQNWIDLDDPIMSSFKQALITEGILISARADAIFDQTGSSNAAPSYGPGGADGHVQYNAAGAFAGAANLTIANGNPNVAASGIYQFNGKNVFRGTDTTYYLSEVGQDSPNATSYAIGYGALQNNTGAANVAVGVKALQNNTTGTYNVAIGENALGGNPSGSNNTVIGAYAFPSSTTSYNVGVGAYSGYNVTSGNNNTVIGGWSGFPTMSKFAVLAAGGEPALWVDAGSGYNTAMGWKAGNLAGISGTSGTGNTSLGAATGYSLTTGNSNTFLGANAGQSVDAGNFNTFVGHYAGQSVTSGNGNTIIGYFNGTATMSSQVVLAATNNNISEIVVQYDCPNKTWQTPTTTVAALPVAGVVGRRAFVTDANAATFNTVLAGGGSNKLPVFDDGTNWRIG